MAFSITTLSIIDLIVTLSKEDIQYNHSQRKHQVSLCSGSYFIISMLNVAVLSGIRLSVFMLNVIMLSVVAPEIQQIMKRFRITLIIEGATEIVI